MLCSTASANTMPTNEKDVESYLRKQCEARRWMCVKFLPDNKVGMPDRVVILPHGHVVWVETKRPKGGRTSAIQKYQHQKLRALGHDVRIVATREVVDALVRELVATYDT